MLTKISIKAWLMFSISVERTISDLVASVQRVSARGKQAPRLAGMFDCRCGAWS